MKKKNIILIIVVIISLILLIIGSILFYKREKPNKKGEETEISSKLGKGTVFSEESAYDSAKKITNETLSAKHCLNEICLTDLVIYESDEFTNIEFIITNVSNVEKEGYLKLVIDNRELTIDYGKMKVQEAKPYYINLPAGTVINAVDYSIRELTTEEFNSISR